VEKALIDTIFFKNEALLKPRKKRRIKEPGEKSWQARIYPVPGEDPIILVQGISYFYSYS
jgi:hypothetical protein